MAIDNPSNLMPDQEIIIEGDAGFVPKASPSDAGKVLGVLNSSGDVGWVVDQSGTFIQVQADWAETDSSQPSYIDNKPDLSVYATASSVDTALAGKQDTISDLSEIRAGAAKGDTAVQPAALDDYATTSAMNTALAGKQDTISDLAAIRAGAQAGSTAVQPATLESYATTSAMNTALAGKQDVINDLSDIRAGAALGATAAQPSDLPSSDELLPSATSGDSGKVLTVNAQGEPGWQTPSSVTVDQTYNASSTNAQAGTAVAGAIAGVKQVPASTSADQNKVLTVNSRGNAVWQNAQTTTYTAGKGVKIANNEISADLEVVQPCLTFGSDFKFDGATQYRATLSNNKRVSVPYNTACKFTLPGNLPNTVQTGMNGGTLKLQIVDSNGTAIQTLKSKYYPDSYLNIPIPQDFYKDVDIPAISVNNCYLRWAWSKTSVTELTISNFDSTAYCFVVPYSGTLALTSPLPASTSSDANKVLTVDSNGAAGWQTPSTVTVDQTYNASSTNAQSGTAVAGALATVNQVPASTSTDANKVLTVDSNGAAGWQTPATVTVDQTYNSSSTNAQSGAAVAQAIASIPSSSYTAGEGIDITSGEISVAYNSNTLDVAPTYSAFVNLTPQEDGSSRIYQEGTELTNWVLNGVEGETIRVKIPNMAFVTDGNLNSGDTMHIAIADYRGARFYSTALSMTYWGGRYMIDAQTVDVPLPVLSTTGWGGSMSEYPIDPESPYIRMTFARVNSGSVLNDYYATFFGVTQQPIQIAKSSGGKLTIKNPLPASAQADSGKVLKVNASGNAEWGPDGFTTTAGITDIQQVAALPANPVATVLYLIPET